MQAFSIRGTSQVSVRVSSKSQQCMTNALTILTTTQRQASLCGTAVQLHYGLAPYQGASHACRFSVLTAASGASVQGDDRLEEDADLEEVEIRLPSGPSSPVVSSARFADMDAYDRQRVWLSVPKALVKIGNKGVSESHVNSLKASQCILL